MRPIDYAMNYISLRIPKEVLEIGFLKGENFEKTTTLQDKILVNVINRHVRPDLDMMGGAIITINLDQCNVNPVDQNFEFVIKVPKSLTDNASIVQPLNLTSRLLNTDLYNLYSGTGGTVPVGLAGKMLNAVDSQPGLTTSNLTLIGDNIVLCREPRGIRLFNYMQVILENEENFSNITPQYFDWFADLCLEATKMFIYNNQVVSLNLGYISNGHELSIIKDIIDGYSDSFEKYTELRRDWSKIAVLNDEHRMKKLIKIVAGGHI